MKNVSNHNEETLMAKLKSGEMPALGELYEMHSASVYRYALRITRSKELAADITQDVFVKIWQFKDRYKPENLFKSWVMRICSNLCLDRIKHHENRNTSFEYSEIEIAGKDQSVEDEVVYRQLGEALARCFYHLSDAHQQLLALRLDGELSVVETALALGCSVRTVHNQTALAVESLRRMAAQTGFKD
ncbi:MAG: sigma-70 family RNA polymerase sigma factor [Candidatus Riflebacteria bacterium]